MYSYYDITSKQIVGSALLSSSNRKQFRKLNQYQYHIYVDVGSRCVNARSKQRMDGFRVEYMLKRNMYGTFRNFAYKLSISLDQSHIQRITYFASMF